MAGLINNWQEAINNAKALTSGWPQWLQQKQAESLDRLDGFAIPNRKMETWRYSDSGKLQNTDVVSSAELDLAELDADLCILIKSQGFEAVGEMPDWLQVTDIHQLAEQEWLPMVAKTHEKEQAMLQLNQALFHAGVALKVKNNEQHADFVIAVVYDLAENAWQFVHNHFEIGDNSQVTINEIHAGGLVNQTAVWSLGRDAQVKKTVWAQFESEATLVSFNQVNLNQNADMKTMNHRFGGTLQHHNQQVEFLAEHAKFAAGSVNKANGNSHIADIVNVFHDKKHNTSEVIHRSIADGQSQIFNNAKAVVAHGADHSEISQDLKNILLSDDAKVFSKPELEVSTDEVVAAHGSTIGALDESSLFYLQSRGIDAKQAKDIMIESFVAEAEVC